MAKEEKKSQAIDVEVTEAVADGVYANLVIITHSPAEFILDFVSVMPGMQKSRVKSRIITNPIHAKRLLKALEENIRKYESVFGAIREGERVEFPIDLGSGTTMQA